MYRRPAALEVKRIKLFFFFFFLYKLRTNRNWTQDNF